MNAIMNKTNNGKLVAAIAIMAMLACVFAVAVPADAADEPNYMKVVAPTGTAGTDYVEVTSVDALNKALEKDIDTIVITGIVGADADTETTIDIPADKTVFIGKSTADTNTTTKVTIGSNVTMNIAGKVYNLVGDELSNTGVVNYGTVNLTGNGIFASTAAVSGDVDSKVKGFFTSSADDVVPDVYRHIYTANIADITAYVNPMSDYADLEGSVKAIHTYGDVEINGTPALTGITLVIGGVQGQASTLTVNIGATINAADVIIKSGSKMIDNTGNVEATATATDNSSYTAAVNAGATAIEYSGKDKIATEITVDVTVTNASAIDGASVGENGKVTFASATEEGSVSIVAGDDLTVNYAGAGTVKIAVASGKTFSASSIQFYYGSEGVIIDKSQGEATITYNSTTGKIQGTITSGNITISGSGTVTVDGKLTFADGAKLTIDSGVTFDAGSGIVGPKEGKATIVNNGVFKYSSLPSTVVISEESTGSYEIADATELGNTIEGVLSVPNASYLVNNITVKSTGTLTIQEDAYLDLMGHTLFLEGTLEILKDATVIDSVGTGKIQISTGSIKNQGVFGAGNSVTVAADTGSVTLTSISGINFATVKNVTGTEGNKVVKYTLSVSGTIEADGKTGSVDFGTGIVIGADTEIDKKLTASGTVTVNGGATLTVDGDASELSVNMLNNSTVIAENNIKTITAKTGDVRTYDAITGDRNVIDKDASWTETSSVDLKNVKGMTVKVTSKNFEIVENGKNVSYTEQMLSVSGALSLVDSKKNAEGTPAESGDANGTIAITGNVYVLAGQSLSYGKSISMTTANTTDVLVTEGKATVTAADVPELNYKGAMYVVTSEGSSDVTCTYTNFTDAFAQIAGADDDTVFLMGGYEFTGEVIIADGQTVTQFDDEETATYSIDSDAKVTVQNGGTLEVPFTTTPEKGIQGILVVMDGGDCDPTEGSFEVMATDADDNVTYSSAQTSIRNATSGTVVEIVDDAVLKDATTIINGVTVNIHEDVTLEAQKGLTVSEGGKVVNDGNLSIGDEYDLTVAGEVESIDGTITLGDTDSEMNVTGIVTVSALLPGNVNGAYYSDDENYVYSSVAKAVTAVAAMDIPVQIYAVGTFTETGTVTLIEDMILNINGTKITLGTIDLEAGADLRISAGAEFNATVTGASGEDASATDASVVLSKVGGVEFTETYNAGATTSALVIAANFDAENGEKLAGTYAVNAGTLTIEGDLTFDGKDATLKVASGATVSVPENASITVSAVNDGKKYTGVTVDGTLDVDGGAITVNKGATILVNGTMAVANSTQGVTVSGNLTITGTLTVSAVDGEEGKVSVDGVLVVGDKPEELGIAGTGSIVGAIDTVTKGSDVGIVKVYYGADISEAQIDFENGTESLAESTEFYINGTLYMTVYAQGTVDIDETFLSSEDFDLLGLVLYSENAAKEPVIDITDITQWYTDAEMTEEADEASVGEPAALYFKANAAKVTVTVSVGSGISLYIDDIRYNSGESVSLAVGTHTVSATVDPGYKGDVTVQFNGQTVTGSFTITPDMASNTFEGNLAVSATGNITQDSTVVVDGGSSGDSGMGLTDYLLIILVILIVVMAIMVAMRLMRS